ncbi:sigma-70 family RNA polymerase sigma factor [Marinicella sp. W31]|uniref:sigma-70 family RNA polymerase sigma factor n=1 Tax=Marinicella sp. W31 TaxID=3023713 RepID=UPI003757D0D1
MALRYNWGMDSRLTDEQLMLKYAAQDDRAFAVLYERHKGPVYRYILKSCTQPAIAQELFQELWLKIIRNKLRYDKQYAFTTWAYTMARNLIIDWLRKSGQEPHNNDVVDSHEVAGMQLQEPDNVFEKKVMMETVQKAVSQLPYAQREVFLLRHEADMSFQAIAAVSGCSLEAAKSRYRYAMEKIKTALERHHE